MSENLDREVKELFETLAKIKNAELLKDLFECIMQVPEIDEMLSPALAIVPLQLLAYYIAEFLGKDVDQPRNLAKSVTVE